MERKNSTKLYNILLPLWFIIFIPSWLWLLLIPANYLIDRIVLKWSLGDLEDKGLFCRKHNWKICLAGFLSDMAPEEVYEVVQCRTPQDTSYIPCGDYGASDREQ